MSENYLDTYIDWNRPKFSPVELWDGQQKSTGTTTPQYLAGFELKTEKELNLYTPQSSQQYKLSLQVPSTPRTHRRRSAPLFSTR